MSTVTPHDTFEVRDEVRSMQDETGMVLLDLAAGKYFSLNNVGALIWQQVVAGRSCQAISDSLRQRFQTSLEKAMADVVAFLNDLREKGLIRDNA